MKRGKGYNVSIVGISAYTNLKYLEEQNMEKS